jgi:coproporphyrinogen III oxidase-like Fe-S oxidoreductase
MFLEVTKRQEPNRTLPTLTAKLFAPTTDPGPLPGGIYVHIPFCQKKCPYCDFYSVSDPSLRPAFFEALLVEIRLLRDVSRYFDSVYIGGGTPSLFEPEHISKVIESLGKTFSIDTDFEITLKGGRG